MHDVASQPEWRRVFGGYNLGCVISLMDALVARLNAALAGRYTLERELGRGGMATVWLAQDLKHDRPVALKVLRPELAAALGPDRFLREILLTARLTHPHILPLHDSGVADGFLFYVMPYVEGESLRDRLNREKQLPLDDALQIAREVADALSYAHSHDVMHRDIKPENILLEARHAVVADFGIARAISTAGGDRLTDTGIAVGTPAYMSPEQGAGSKQLDGRSDLYSLGCVLYEMLAGHPPFHGSTAHEVLARHATDPMPPLRTGRTTIPEPIAAAVERALAKVPVDRFGTAQQFSQALTVDTPEYRRQQRTRRTVRRVAFGVVALVLGVVGVAALATWGPLGGRGRGREVGEVVSSAHRVAVFPFDVQAGPDRLYLGDAVAGLLGDAIDGVGQLRRVDQRAVVGQVERGGEGFLDPVGARRLARRLGAGRFVLGTVSDLGRRIRVSASVYDLERGAEPVATEARDGDPRAVGDLAVELAQALLTHLPLGQGIRLESIAGVRAANPEALRAYLDGESFLSRAKPDSAALRFLAATALDSTFALAWHRLMWAQDFLPRYHEVLAASADQAIRWRDRLSEGDRVLAEMAHAYAHGDGRRLEALARRATDANPTLAEAWWYLGVAQHWHGWQWGRSPHRATEFYRRVLDLEPFHWFAFFELTWLALMDGDYDAADSLIRLQVSRGMDPPYWGTAVSAIRTLASANEARRQQFIAGMAARPSGEILSIVGRVIRFSDALDDAVRILRVVTDSADRPPQMRADAYWWIGAATFAAGRWRQGSEAWNAADRFDQAGSTATERVLATAVPFFARPEAEVRALRDSLSHWPTYTRGVPPELHPYLRTYLNGLLSARLGDEVQAARDAVVLERARAPGDSAGLLADWALEVRALSAMEGGREAEALATLERQGLRITWHYQTRFLHRRIFGRFLRAELLLRAGRHEEALGWYEGFGMLGGDVGDLWMSPVYLRRGEIHERLGHREEALRNYRRFVARWRDADPEYQPLRRDVEARVKRLTGEQRG